MLTDKVMLGAGNTGVIEILRDRPFKARLAPWRPGCDPATIARRGGGGMGVMGGTGEGKVG